MSTTCRDIEALLALRATGALALDERTRVENHLATCAVCQAAAADVEELLDYARLPTPSAAERRALDELPQRVRTGLRHARRRRIIGGAAAAFALAASVALVIWTSTRSTQPQVPGPEVSVAWQEPDVDELWREAGLLEGDAAVTGDDALGDGMAL